MRFAGIIEPGVASGIVTYAKHIQGAYIVVKNITERDAIKPKILVNGSHVYVGDLEQIHIWRVNPDTEQGTWEVVEGSFTVLGYLLEGDFYRTPAKVIKYARNSSTLYIDVTETPQPYFYNPTSETYVSLSTDLTEIEDRLLALETGKQDKIDATHKISADYVTGLATVAKTGKYSDLTNTPTKLSEFTNDSGFVDKTVSDLANYYNKDNSYNRTQVDNLIASIKKFEVVVVATLPEASAQTMNKLYLVPSAKPSAGNAKDEYITVDNGESSTPRYKWELIGSTVIDLTDYYKKSEVDALLNAKQDLIDATHKLKGSYLDVDCIYGGDADDYAI